MYDIMNIASRTRKLDFIVLMVCSNPKWVNIRTNFRILIKLFLGKKKTAKDQSLTLNYRLTLYKLWVTHSLQTISVFYWSHICEWQSLGIQWTVDSSIVLPAVVLLNMLMPLLACQVISSFKNPNAWSMAFMLEVKVFAR